MRELPDLRNEVRAYFESLKGVLVNSVQAGHFYTPFFAYVTLTPFAQAKLNQPEMICLAPTWDTNEERVIVLKKFVEFINMSGDCVILCGSGRGTYSGIGDGEVSYLFVTLYMPAFTPWTIAQVYTVIEREVIFDVECCSADSNVKPFNLPGLWPDGKAPA